MTDPLTALFFVLAWLALLLSITVLMAWLADNMPRLIRRHRRRMVECKKF